MSFRTVVISRKSRLSLKLGQLICHNDEGEVSLPLDDINAIVIESLDSSLTTSLLSAFAEYGIAVITCDDKHIPNGCLNTFHGHSRNSLSARKQAEWSEPFKKRCWQKIVRQKITNQAHVLKELNNDQHLQLINLLQKVDSGDSKNIEAQAARIYFQNLHPNFKRWNDSFISSGLNYGYAIIRGAIARSLVAYGFLPVFGLHHSSELNAFNLADDIIEPFRPQVDRMVINIASTKDEGSGELSKQDRAEIASVLSSQIIINEEYVSFTRACDVTVMSLQKATDSKDSKDLKLPSLTKSHKGHAYE